MKIEIVLILILFFFLVACSNNSTEYHKVEHISDTLYGYDANSTLRIKAPLKKGKKHGEVLMFDKNGKILRIENYINDTLNGFLAVYYPSGVEKANVYYIDGKKYGNYHEFYDGYQDSMIVSREGVDWLVPYSTKLKKFKFYSSDRVLYLRDYNIEGDLIKQEGKLFNFRIDEKIEAKVGKPVVQQWTLPDPSNLDQVDIDLYVIVSNLTLPENKADTIFLHTDSTVVRWNSSFQLKGKYDFRAVAYLSEKGRIETDTSLFEVIINE